MSYVADLQADKRTSVGLSERNDGYKAERAFGVHAPVLLIACIPLPYCF